MCPPKMYGRREIKLYILKAQKEISREDEGGFSYGGSSVHKNNND